MNQIKIINLNIAPDKCEYLTVTDAAKELGVTRQEIWLLIKQQKLKAKKTGYFYTIHKDDLYDWVNNKKFSRDFRKNDKGEYIFDHKNTFSTKTAAKYLGCNPQRLYYLMKIGQMQFTQFKGVKIFHKEQLDEYKKKIKTLNFSAISI